MKKFQHPVFWRITFLFALMVSMTLQSGLTPCRAADSGGSDAAGKEDERKDAGRRIGEFERRMIGAGLVNVKAIDPTLLVELKYASANNFMGEAVYGDLKECYLQREAALKLRKAHDLLKAHDPSLRLLLGDGCRPRTIQRRMFDIVKGTPMQKYVANPSAVSMHNYGAAVDITIACEDGTRLDMGAPMDHFGILSHPGEETRLLKEGKLTQEHVTNRRLLREVMTKAGFQGLSIEWWHFNAFDRKLVKGKYKIIE